MARNLKEKMKMPPKGRMAEDQAGEELDMDMPELDTPAEAGQEEADDDFLASMEPKESSAEEGPLAEIADEDLIEEMKKRGLSMDDAAEDAEVDADDAEMAEDEEASY